MTDLSLIHRTHAARVGNAPHPGLLLLHGRGADENDLLPLAAELDPRLFTVSARAPFEFPWGGAMWYELDSRGIGFPETRSLHASLDLLHTFMTEIADTYPIDPQRLYVGGFSMGAVMSGTLALLEPAKIAGAIMLSGYLALHNNLPFRPDQAIGHPFFQAHGVHDTVIPVSFASEACDYLTTADVDLTYREYPIAHQIGTAELQDLDAWLTAALDSRSVDSSQADEAPSTSNRNLT
jgi:phospholipase/carboxylesterase